MLSTKPERIQEKERTKKKLVSFKKRGSLLQGRKVEKPIPTRVKET